MKKIKITLVKSPSGKLPAQRATVKALGLRKLHQSVQRDVNPALLGMVKAVAHLVVVEEVKV